MIKKMTGHSIRRLATGILIFTALGGLTVAAPDVRGDDMEPLTTGNNQFAIDLYQRLITRDGNLFLSPYSISTALAMTYAGARGETANQIRATLRFPFDQDRLHPAFSQLARLIQQSTSASSKCQLNLANALFLQTGHPFLDAYTDLVKRHYDAELRQLDFAGDADGARRTINEWVEEKTAEMIVDLLNKGDIDRATLLVLVNAIWFKGAWASEFNSDHTRQAQFQIDPETKVTVPMMHQKTKFPFMENDEISMIELPYAGEDLVMNVILPKRKDGLGEIERTLNAERLQSWLGGLSVQDVSVSFPKCQLESRFDLGEMLQAMGMIDAFSGQADFSGMTGARDMFISRVIHQARIEIDEKGTEAAAATAVVMKRMAILPKSFIADHPFLFLIRDRQTGSILFLGRLSNPS